MKHKFDIEKYVNDNIEKGFNETILLYILEHNLDSVSIYNKANLHRRIFSRLYNTDYTPSKNTAICLCIALNFDYDKTQYMLKKLGYTLSKSNKFDLIITFYIKNKLFDIYEINDYLDSKGYQILGSIIKEKKKAKVESR